MNFPRLQFAASGAVMTCLLSVGAAHSAITGNAMAGNAMSGNAIAGNAIAGNPIASNALARCTNRDSIANSRAKAPMTASQTISSSKAATSSAPKCKTHPAATGPISLP